MKAVYTHCAIASGYACMYNLFKAHMDAIVLVCYTVTIECT